MNGLLETLYLPKMVYAIIFNFIVLQPPYGSAVADKNFHEKQIRLQEVLGGITTHFKRLRVCWEKANVST